MGIADHLERVADIVEAPYGEQGLATALRAVCNSSREFSAAKDAFLRSTRFVTLADYVAERGRKRETIVADLRRAAQMDRAQVPWPKEASR